MRKEVMICAQIREKGGVVHMFHIIKNQKHKKQLLRFAKFVKLITDIIKNIMEILNF